MQPYPDWLLVLAWAYLAICVVTALVIVIDLQRLIPKMWIMNLVWPITALYLGPVALWLYDRTRSVATKDSPSADEKAKEKMKLMDPTREQISAAVIHCGAGCTLGDIIGEGGLFLLGGASFIAGSDFATKLFVDLLLAYTFGIFFQYFTIVPMRGLSPLKGIGAAIRADTISIAAFELGMFGWMIVTRYILFPEPNRLHPDSVVFWLMMQIAMIIGCITAYPANLWLIKKQWKEKMPQYSSLREKRHHEIPRRVA